MNPQRPMAAPQAIAPVPARHVQRTSRGTVTTNPHAPVQVRTGAERIVQAAARPVPRTRNGTAPQRKHVQELRANGVFRQAPFQPHIQLPEQALQQDGAMTHARNAMQRSSGAAMTRTVVQPPEGTGAVTGAATRSAPHAAQHNHGIAATKQPAAVPVESGAAVAEAQAGALPHALHVNLHSRGIVIHRLNAQQQARVGVEHIARINAQHAARNSRGTATVKRNAQE